MLNKRGFEKMDLLILLIAILFATLLIWNYFSGFLDKAKEKEENLEEEFSGEKEIFGSPTQSFYDESGKELYGFFREGTKVMMFDRTWKNIETIKEGNYVLGFDTEEKEQKFLQVKKTREFKLKSYYVLNNNLEVTFNTLIFSNGQWKLIRDVKYQDILKDINNHDLFLENLYGVDKGALFFNLEMEEPYTFYVKGAFSDRDSSEGITIKDTRHMEDSFLVKSRMDLQPSNT